MWGPVCEVYSPDAERHDKVNKEVCNSNSQKTSKKVNNKKYKR